MSNWQTYARNITVCGGLLLDPPHVRVHSDPRHHTLGSNETDLKNKKIEKKEPRQIQKPVLGLHGAQGIKFYSYRNACDWCIGFKKSVLR